MVSLLNQVPAAEDSELGVIIRKVKITNFGLMITYDEQQEHGKSDSVVREGKELARPCFYNAMDALRDDVIKLCFLKREGWNQAQIKSVTLKYTEDGKDCAIALDNTLPNVVISQTIDLEAHNISKSLAAKIESVIAEAVLYLDGQRAQLNLFNQIDDETNAN